ncbi:glucosyltransferase domain-containing protein [Tepidibacter mesophilus]|uniref:glucosyltransferase domain-containing protein n=1 Tax=Tepidibacter mesophilus TaxID=655607 RepID=UPI000C0768DE|nr:glucosyltransferase domain-containing protein [Tepidibacter mesophilus]
MVSTKSVEKIKSQLNKVSSPSDAIGIFWKGISIISKTVFFAAIVIGLLSHLYFFVHKFANEDDIAHLNTALFYTKTSGRWFLGYITQLRGFYSLPVIIGAISIFFCAISAVLTAKLLRTKKTVTAFIIGALMASFPVLSYSFCYLFMADAYMYALFFAVLAVFLTNKYKFGFILGGISLSLSLGIYQSYIGYAIGLVLIILINLLIDNELDLKKIGLEILKYFTMGVLGAIFYFVSLKINLYLTGSTLLSYKGIDKMGHIDLYKLPSLVLRSYKNFFNSFAGKYYPVSGTLHSLYIVELIIGIVAIMFLIFKNNIYKKTLHLILLICGIALLPPGLNIVDVMAPETQSATLNIYQFVLIFIFVATLVEKIEFNFANLIKWCSFICLGLIIFNFILLNNTYYLKAEIYFNRTFSLTSRMLDRIEQLPEFEKTNKVALIGKLPNSFYKDSSIMFSETDNQGFWGQYVGFNSSNNEDNTRKFIANANIFHGARFIRANKEEMKTAVDDAINMPIWPQQGSIDCKNGVIIVHLSNVFKVETHNIGKDKYHFEFLTTPNSNYTYAWYVYKDDTKVDVIWYKPENYFDYTFVENGKYKIQGFYKDAKGIDKGSAFSQTITVKGINY